MKRTSGTLTLESRVSTTHSEYHFHTADGVCSKQSFRTAELLLLESLWDFHLGHLLCLEANYGVVGIVLSENAESVQMTESSARAVTLCEQNIRENRADASVTLLAGPTASDWKFDTVAYAPKPYTALPIAKQRIADAIAVLRPGGSFYLSASKYSGLTRYEDCLRELTGTVEQVNKNGEYRLLKATRPQVYNPSSYVCPRRIHPTVNGVDLALVTMPGLFSGSAVDAGTRLLLETTTIEDGERVLDLCCGYGPIGVYAGQTADCELWLSDDDTVATKCAERSLQASNVDGTVVTADCVEGVAGQTFDRILCNPPTHAGDEVLTELFTGIRKVLASDGRLTIVHHRELNLRPYLTCYSNVEKRQTGAEHVVLSMTSG